MLLQRHVTSLGSTYSVAQRNDLLDRRGKLEGRITTYEHRILVIIKLDDDTQGSTQDGKIPDMDPQPGDVLDDLLELYPDGWFTPEWERITVPSALAPGEITRLSLQPFAMIEAELRKGQVEMLLKDFVWPLVRSPCVSKWKCATRIVRGQHIEHGTMFISWMHRLESPGPHIDMPKVHCSI